MGRVIPFNIMYYSTKSYNSKIGVVRLDEAETYNTRYYMSLDEVIHL